MAKWRGAYDSEDAARTLIADSGGLSMLWIVGMVGAGLWSEPGLPMLGDVGVVRVMGVNGPEEVGAIYGGKRWHMLSPDGLYSASIDKQNVSMIWRV